MRKLITGLALATMLGAAPALADTAKEITVYKSPDCGCCGGWADHMRASGYRVTEKNQDDMSAVKALFGVPDELLSCHTATIDGYVVEGHVPASDIDRLLADRPDVAGLSAPGMPADSPGMDAGTGEPYDVFAFDRDGEATHYATH